MPIRALGYIGIQARDLAAWKRFSVDMLGLEAFTHGDCLLLRVDDRSWRIWLEAGDSDDLAFVGWETSSEQSLSDAVAIVQESGIHVERDTVLARRRGVTHLARFIDPAGVSCELFCGATERPESPVTLSCGISGYVTGDQGLGHVVIAAENPAAYEDFYRSLGFGLADNIFMAFDSETQIPLTFMYCNPRHHTLAFAPIPSPKRLFHFMLQTNTLDDVGLAWDRATRLEIPIAMSLGRHTNDRMFSFYMNTPSGVEVEYGFGARTIGEDWLPARYDAISIWGHRPMHKHGPSP